jgi:hypothetical protein
MSKSFKILKKRHKNPFILCILHLPVVQKDIENTLKGSQSHSGTGELSLNIKNCQIYNERKQQYYRKNIIFSAILL